jgi:hypothetical protein
LAIVPVNVRAAAVPVTVTPSAEFAAIVPAATLSVTVIALLAGESASANGAPANVRPVGRSSTTVNLAGTTTVGAVAGSATLVTVIVNCFSVARPPGNWQ